MPAACGGGDHRGMGDTSVSGGGQVRGQVGRGLRQVGDRVGLVLCGVACLVDAFVVIPAIGFGVGMASDPCSGSDQPAVCASFFMTHSHGVIEFDLLAPFVVLGVAAALAVAGRRVLGRLCMVLGPLLPLLSVLALR